MMDKVYLAINCEELILGRLLSLITKLFLNKNSINYNSNQHNNNLFIYFFNINKLLLGKKDNIKQLKFIRSKRLGHSKFKNVKESIVKTKGEFIKRIFSGMLPNNSFKYKILNRCCFFLENYKINNIELEKKIVEIPKEVLNNWLMLSSWYFKMFKN